MPRTRRLRVDEVNVADHEKSCEDWSKLKMEVLKLKCNQYGLVSTRKKPEVQQRLMAHFRTNHDNDDDVSIITDTDSMNVTGMTKTFVYWWHLKAH